MNSYMLITQIRQLPRFAELAVFVFFFDLLGFLRKFYCRIILKQISNVQFHAYILHFMQYSAVKLWPLTSKTIMPINGNLKKNKKNYHIVE